MNPTICFLMAGKKWILPLVGFILNSWFPNSFESQDSSIVSYSSLFLFSKHLPFFFGLRSSLAFLLITLPDDGLISYFTKKIKAFSHYFQIDPSFLSLLFRGRNTLTFLWGTFHLPYFFTSIMPLDVSLTWDFVLRRLILFSFFSKAAFINNQRL